jgi:hypothetical protein
MFILLILAVVLLALLVIKVAPDLLTKAVIAVLAVAAGLIVGAVTFLVLGLSVEAVFGTDPGIGVGLWVYLSPIFLGLFVIGRAWEAMTGRIFG